MTLIRNMSERSFDQEDTAVFLVPDAQQRESADPNVTTQRFDTVPIISRRSPDGTIERVVHETRTRATTHPSVATLDPTDRALIDAICAHNLPQTPHMEQLAVLIREPHVRQVMIIILSAADSLRSFGRMQPTVIHEFLQGSIYHVSEGEKAQMSQLLQRLRLIIQIWDKSKLADLPTHGIVSRCGNPKRIQRLIEILEAFLKVSELHWRNAGELERVRFAFKNGETETIEMEASLLP